MHKEAIQFLKDHGGECDWGHKDMDGEMSTKLLDACIDGYVKSIETSEKCCEGFWKLIKGGKNDA